MVYPLVPGPKASSTLDPNLSVGYHYTFFGQATWCGIYGNVLLMELGRVLTKQHSPYSVRAQWRGYYKRVVFTCFESNWNKHQTLFGTFLAPFLFTLSLIGTGHDPIGIPWVVFLALGQSSSSVWVWVRRILSSKKQNKEFAFHGFLKELKIDQHLFLKFPHNIFVPFMVLICYNVI